MTQEANVRHEDLIRRYSLDPLRLYGADGEGEGGEEDPQAGADGGGGSEPQTYSQEYVDKLRKEAAGHRVKGNEKDERIADLEKTVSELKKAEMDDIDRLRTENEEKDAEIAALKEVNATTASNLRTERIHNAVMQAAADWNDPSDALSMVSQDDIIDDEGNVDHKAIKSQLKKVTDKKPYLLKQGGGAGSGDGGAGGSAPDPEDENSFEARKARHMKKFQEESGRVIVNS